MLTKIPVKSDPNNSQKNPGHHSTFSLHILPIPKYTSTGKWRIISRSTSRCSSSSFCCSSALAVVFLFSLSSFSLINVWAELTYSPDENLARACWSLYRVSHIVNALIFRKRHNPKPKTNEILFVRLVKVYCMLALCTSSRAFRFYLTQKNFHSVLHFQERLVKQSGIWMLQRRCTPPTPPRLRKESHRQLPAAMKC